MEDISRIYNVERNTYVMTDQVNVEKRSRNIWRASGFHGLRFISATGYSEHQAIELWRLNAIQSDPIKIQNLN